MLNFIEKSRIGIKCSREAGRPTGKLVPCQGWCNGQTVVHVECVVVEGVLGALQPTAQQSLSQCFLIVTLLNPWETRKEGFRFCSEILHCPQASFFHRAAVTLPVHHAWTVCRVWFLRIASLAEGLWGRMQTVLRLPLTRAFLYRGHHVQIPFCALTTRGKVAVWDLCDCLLTPPFSGISNSCLSSC